VLVVAGLGLAACGDDEPLSDPDESADTTESSSEAGPGQPGGPIGGGPAARRAPSAVADMLDPEGVSIGLVTFTPVGAGDDEATDVAVELSGSTGDPDTFHGLHVHANDQPSNGQGCEADPDDDPGEWFTSVDAHLGAGDGDHGTHQGDLPSLLVGPDGTASARWTTGRFTVDDVIGAAVVLHAGPDNFGNVPVDDGPDAYTPNSDEAVETTDATGNAGDRIACGVIRAGSGGAGDPAR
jgi:Cu-Zn family superoxide dismutase